MRDDELRAVGPPSLTPQRHAALRSALLDEIADGSSSSQGPRQDPSRLRSVRRRGVVGVGTVLAVVSLSAVAAAAVMGWMRPDPVETKAVIDRSAEVVEQHNPGWRPELMAEQVQCASSAAEPPAFTAMASDFPLGASITPADYVRACVSKAATLDSALGASAPLLCGRRGPIIAELVVVATGSCNGTEGLTAVTSDDMAALNEARAVEVSLLAFPESCPSPSQAAAWVRSQLDTEQVPLTLIDPVADPATTTSAAEGNSSEQHACYRGWVSWPSSTVTIDAYKLPN